MQMRNLKIRLRLRILRLQLVIINFDTKSVKILWVRSFTGMDRFTGMDIKFLPEWIWILFY